MRPSTLLLPLLPLLPALTLASPQNGAYTWQPLGGSPSIPAGIPYAQMASNAPAPQHAPSQAAAASWGAPSVLAASLAPTPTPVASWTPAASVVASPAAGGDWQTAVTWPAGCETWANPCPPGAHIAGGSIVGGKAAATAVVSPAAASSATTLATMKGNGTYVTPSGRAGASSTTAGTHGTFIASSQSSGAGRRHVVGGLVGVVLVAGVFLGWT
ncbi:hypothetical protein EJ06DRAFT_531648 [Trichodelitschia bisporula]|uniref:Uncharacterized protein n=1 Tax=Trichodelitschia bisporula TaxID=703511 RepID=A0A6G1HTI5_9PEZI|nr:hypothetical protein EJ06DRAFT_531648 [Trichodelitschia bisporula]